MCKSERNIEVHPNVRHLLGMEKDQQLFVYTLSGCSQPPSSFSAVVEALVFLNRQQDVPSIGHYLDDYVLVGQQIS